MQQTRHFKALSFPEIPKFQTTDELEIDEWLSLAVDHRNWDLRLRYSLSLVQTLARIETMEHNFSCFWVRPPNTRQHPIFVWSIRTDERKIFLFLRRKIISRSLGFPLVSASSKYKRTDSRAKFSIPQLQM